MRRIVRCSLSAGAVLVLCLVSSSAQQPLQTLHRHVRHAVSNGQATPMGHLDPAQHLQFSIVLQPRNQEQLTSLLSRIYDPLSPDYHKFLSVAQFADQFAPTAEDYQSVIDYARAQGFKVKGRSANRMLVSLEGTVAQVEAAFHVTMGTYQHPTEARTFFSPDREPSLALEVPVLHVAGLNNFSRPRPAAVRRDATNNAAPFVTGSGPGGAYRGSDMRAAYYGGTALNGAGQTVGLFEFDGYNLSDVNLTFSNTGESYNVPINNVLIDGATGAPTSGDDDAEEVLDIVQAIDMAPGLDQVRVYIGNANNAAADADILNAIATEDIAQEVSISWGWAPDDPQTDDVFFQEMAAQGQSVFVASGDSGAFDASISPFFYPAEDDYVTTVGGTHLSTNGAGGTWSSETAWTDSGGGISPDQIPIPSWQSGVATVSNQGSTHYRNVPDVAMEADFDNYTCHLGSCAGDWGGTSFATPRWAAYIALANQQAAEAGETGLGFLNPVIYPLAEGANYSTNFHDIASGNNDSGGQPVWFKALAGYDLVTGWGSPKGQNLINTLAPITSPGFILTAAPRNLFVAPGSSGSVTVNIVGGGGFSGGVNLSVSGLPAGVTAMWSSNPATAASTLTLSADVSVLGSFPLIVTGTSGALTRSTTFLLTVAGPSFTLNASPNTYTLNPGTSTNGNLNLTGANGFSGAVNLSVTGLPSGVTVTFGSNPTGSSTSITIAASNTATPGTSTLTISGVAQTNGQISASTKITVTVLPTTVPPSSLFAPSSANFGSLVTGSPSAVQTFTYTFTSAATVGSTAVLTQGVTGLDFANAGTGTCAANTQYAAGQSCTVNVLFTPRFAGTRYGAVVLRDSIGNLIAIAYLYGTGLGPQVTFQPSSQSTIATFTGGVTWTSGVAVDGGGNVYIVNYNRFGCGSAQLVKETLSNGSYTASVVPTSTMQCPYGIALDGAGNIYVTDTSNFRVLKETPFGASYDESTVATFPVVGGSAPIGVAVDGSGNVYISLGVSAGMVEKETLTASGYVQSTAVSGLPVDAGIAVDGSGSIYIAVDQTNGWIVKATPGANGYTQSTIPVSSGGLPFAVAVDGSDNVYVAFIDNNDVGQIFKETLTANGYSQSTIPSGGLNQPYGIAVDGAGNVYVADAFNSRAVEENLATPPSLKFATTALGATSTDSPQTVTVTNTGNNNLTFSALSYPADFPSGTGVNGICASSTPVAAGKSCALSINFSPVSPLNGASSALLNETVAMTTNAVPQTQSIALSGTETQTATTTTTVSGATATYTSSAQSVSLLARVTSTAGTVNAGTVTFTVLNGATSVGTPTTSGTVVNGAASVSYVLPVGTAAGTYTIQAAYSGSGNSFNGSNGTGLLIIGQATPIITWPTPVAITYGTALSAAQLNATASVPGTFAYSPPAGTVLLAGTQTLSVTFTPTDTTDYSTTSASVSLTVNRATPALTWSTPAAITYGTALSSTQLKATANVPGTFAYSPAAGTVLPAGKQTLNVTFTPADTTDYTTATKSVTLTVNLATPKFSPGGGSYTSAQTVTITDSPGATIYYTTNGSTPNTSSTLYQSPVNVSAGMTIKAIAVESGLSNSAVASATYSFKVPTPVIGPPGSSTYTVSKAVPITDSNSNAVIWYTTDGSAPVPGQGTAVQYTGTPVQITQTTVLKAVAAVSGWTTSSAVSATYTLKVPTPVIGPPGSGTYTVSKSVPISDSNSSAVIWYTTDGTTPVPGQGTALQYTGTPVQITQSSVLKAVAAVTGWTTSSATSATYTLKVPTPVIGPPGTGTFIGMQAVPISDSNSSAVIWFTTDGTTPVPGQGTAVQYVNGSPVQITQTTVLKAVAAVTGWTTSGTASATYTIH